MVKQSDIIIMDDKPVSTTGVSAVKMCWTSIKLTVSQKVANKQLKCHKKSKNILKFNNYNKQLPIPFVNHYFNPDAWETAISIPTHGKPLFQFDAWETIISIPTREKPLPYFFTYMPSDFFNIWHKSLGNFFTRNGVRLIAKGLGFKNKYKFNVNAKWP